MYIYIYPNTVPCSSLLYSTYFLGKTSYACLLFPLYSTYFLGKTSYACFHYIALTFWAKPVMLVSIIQHLLFGQNQLCMFRAYSTYFLGTTSYACFQHKALTFWAKPVMPVFQHTVKYLAKPVMPVHCVQYIHDLWQTSYTLYIMYSIYINFFDKLSYACIH